MDLDGGPALCVAYPPPGGEAAIPPVTVTVPYIRSSLKRRRRRVDPGPHRAAHPAKDDQLESTRDPRAPTGTCRGGLDRGRARRRAYGGSGPGPSAGRLGPSESSGGRRRRRGAANLSVTFGRVAWTMPPGELEGSGPSKQRGPPGGHHHRVTVMRWTR